MSAISSPSGAPPSDLRWQVAREALSSSMTGFEDRPGQQQMSQAIAEVLAVGADLLVEAGTGTGKTLGYLLPVLGAGKRAVVAVATRQLQDQILQHDLPLALKATGAMLEVALLKGRSNYLCRHRLDRQMHYYHDDHRAAPSSLLAVDTVARSAGRGDKAEVAGVAADDPVWPDVTSTADNCLGSECDFYEDCFVVQARRRALQADLVIANHHILLANYSVQERFEGAGLLPEVDVIVIDEAHELEDAVSGLFGLSLSSARIEWLVRDLQNLLADHGVAGVDMDSLFDGLSSAARLLYTTLSMLPLEEALDPTTLAELEEPVAELDQAIGRLIGGLKRQLTEMSTELHTAVDAFGTLRQDLDQLLGGQDSGDDLVCWVEQRRRSIAVKASPVSVSAILQRTLFSGPSSRILTSATLAVGTDFGPLKRRLGLDESVRCLQVTGGFDYQSQALLYVPRHLPGPFQPGRQVAVADEIERLAMLSVGGGFALFTSYREMRDAHRRLQARLPFPCLLQGQESKALLIERFVREQPALLFATMGFWQGVDLPGDALRLVILDKIPFPSPKEPLFAARCRRIEAAGKSSFAELSVPLAATALRQGFGRLIRSQSDWGVVAILDPRLVRRGYGRRLLAALPPARRTQAFPVAWRFMQERLDSMNPGPSVEP